MRPTSGIAIIITGGHSGLGFASTKALAAAGAKVIVGARNKASAEKTLSELPNVTVFALNLADLDNMKHFVDDIVASGETVDILICNAGIMANTNKWCCVCRC